MSEGAGVRGTGIREFGKFKNTGIRVGGTARTGAGSYKFKTRDIQRAL